MNVFLGIIGLIATIAMGVAVILVPFVLYKGFKNKDWKLGKTAIIIFVSGLIVQTLTFVLYAILAPSA